MDILKKLRDQVNSDMSAGTPYLHQILLDSANEIEKLREALRQLISIAERCDSWESFPSEALEDAEKALI